MLVVDPAAFARAAETLTVAARTCTNENGLKVFTGIPTRMAKAPWAPDGPETPEPDYERIRAIALGAVVALTGSAARVGDEVELRGFSPGQISRPEREMVMDLNARQDIEGGRQALIGPPMAYLEYTMPSAKDDGFCCAVYVTIRSTGLTQQQTVDRLVGAAHHEFRRFIEGSGFFDETAVTVVWRLLPEVSRSADGIGWYARCRLTWLPPGVAVAAAQAA